MDKIPDQLKRFWEPCDKDQAFFHITTKQNYQSIKNCGYIEPRDPSVRKWAGMKAIFLSDPDDELYAKYAARVVEHVKEKHEHLVKLHIKTKNQLYKSTHPTRTFQVISLSKIPVDEIVSVEPLI